MSLGTCWLCAEPVPGMRICSTCYSLRYVRLGPKLIRRRHPDVLKHGINMSRDKARAAAKAIMQAHRSTLDKLAKPPSSDD